MGPVLRRNLNPYPALSQFKPNKRSRVRVNLLRVDRLLVRLTKLPHNEIHASTLGCFCMALAVRDQMFPGPLYSSHNIALCNGLSLRLNPRVIQSHSNSAFATVPL